MSEKANSYDRCDQATDGYLAYESAYFKHACEMGNVHHDGQFDPDHALHTADQLQEAMFEAVEAGSFDEFTGLNNLRSEIVTSQGTALHFGYMDLALELEKRDEQLQERITSIQASLSQTALSL